MIVTLFRRDYTDVECYLTSNDKQIDLTLRIQHPVSEVHPEQSTDETARLVSRDVSKDGTDGVALDHTWMVAALAAIECEGVVVYDRVSCLDRLHRRRVLFGPRR